MIWHSAALGEDNRPAILALACRRAGRVLRVEALFVGANLPPGPLEGTFIPGPGSDGWPLTLDWPQMPWNDTFGKLHPSIGWTPEPLLAEEGGVDYVDIPLATAARERGAPNDHETQDRWNEG